MKGNPIPIGKLKNAMYYSFGVYFLKNDKKTDRTSIITDLLLHLESQGVALEALTKPITDEQGNLTKGFGDGIDKALQDSIDGKKNGISKELAIWIKKELKLKEFREAYFILGVKRRYNKA